MAHWLIVSGSAHALARACIDAGMTCDVIDPWGDTDTRALARRYEHCPLGGTDFSECLPQRVEEMARSSHWDGIVTGSGFEGRPWLIDALGRHAPLIGNDAATVARCKSPQAIVVAARTAGLRAADVLEHGLLDDGWLVKPLGGCGGQGVRRAGTNEPVPAGCFGQRRVVGTTASVLFLADGHTAQLVGVSRQTPGSVAGPFAWCEAVGDLPLAESRIRQLADALHRMVAEFGLRGLNGVDLVFDADDEPVPIEINPRPTATISLYPDRVKGGLFAAHVAAHAGRLDSPLQAPSGKVRGLRVVYAPVPASIGKAVRWPAWCTDLPQPGTSVAAAAPLCTVHASAADGNEVSALLRQRECEVLDMPGLHSEAGQTTTVLS